MNKLKVSNAELRRQFIMFMIFIVAALAQLDKQGQLAPVLALCLFAMSFNYINKVKFLKNNPNMTSGSLNMIIDFLVMTPLILYFGCSIILFL